MMSSSWPKTGSSARAEIDPSRRTVYTHAPRFLRPRGEPVVHGYDPTKSKTQTVPSMSRLPTRCGLQFARRRRDGALTWWISC
jgi:hypothetical protein